MNTLLVTPPNTQTNFRELRLGEFGYLLADLSTKTVHISNMVNKESGYELDHITSDNFAALIVKASLLFEDQKEYQSVLKEIELIFSDYFEGTY